MFHQAYGTTPVKRSPRASSIKYSTVVGWTNVSVVNTPNANVRFVAKKERIDVLHCLYYYLKKIKKCSPLPRQRCLGRDWYLHIKHARPPCYSSLKMVWVMVIFSGPIPKRQKGRNSSLTGEVTNYNRHKEPPLALCCSSCLHPS